MPRHTAGPIAARGARSWVYAALAVGLTLSAVNRAAADEFGGLFLMRPDGSDLKQLLVIDGYTDLSSPRWSHDGEQIVVSAEASNGQRDCFLLNADGSNVRNLVQARIAEWSPDDKQIVFKTSTAPPIFAQNLDGTGRTQIGEGHSPSWSPDGGRLAVSDKQMVRLVDMVSGDERTVFDRPQNNIFAGFSWSPDSKLLAVVIRPQEGKPRELFVVDTLADPPRLHSRATGEMGGWVSFSPDGRQIVFSDSLRIRIVDVEGDKLPRILPGQKGHNRNPDWSPDGKWIVFVGSTETPK